MVCISNSKQELREVDDEAIDQSPATVRMLGETSKLMKELQRQRITLEKIRDDLKFIADAFAFLAKESAGKTELNRVMRNRDNQIKLTQTAQKTYGLPN